MRPVSPMEIVSGLLTCFEHFRSLQDELQPLIERAFRNLGYFKTRADEPKTSAIRQKQGSEDVSVRVDQIAQERWLNSSSGKRLWSTFSRCSRWKTA